MLLKKLYKNRDITTPHNTQPKVAATAPKTLQFEVQQK